MYHYGDIRRLHPTLRNYTRNIVHGTVHRVLDMKREGKSFARFDIKSVSNDAGFWPKF
jgi:hypothetical protein